ncbi:MAG: hypothetical protein KKD44_27875 [Proteobacteria bacterium]|nr:hypothetical protein [Pseudomonadota bacterium]
MLMKLMINRLYTKDMLEGMSSSSLFRILRRYNISQDEASKLDMKTRIKHILELQNQLEKQDPQRFCGTCGWVKENCICSYHPGKPLRIEAKARNNILWHMIFDKYESVVHFCRVHDLGQWEVGMLLNLTRSPKNAEKVHDKYGEWSTVATKLAEIFHTPESTLFPEELYRMKNTKAVIETEPIMLPITEEVLALPDPGYTPDEYVEYADMELEVRRVLSTLTVREELVLKKRFGIGQSGSEDTSTLEEIGQNFGVCRNRIGQIEAKALRKLRHPSRGKRIKVFLQDANGYARIIR